MAETRRVDAGPYRHEGPPCRWQRQPWGRRAPQQHEPQRRQRHGGGRTASRAAAPGKLQWLEGNLLRLPGYAYARGVPSAAAARSSTSSHSWRRHPSSKETFPAFLSTSCSNLLRVLCVVRVLARGAGASAAAAASQETRELTRPLEAAGPLPSEEEEEMEEED